MTPANYRKYKIFMWDYIKHTWKGVSEHTSFTEAEEHAKRYTEENNVITSVAGCMSCFKPSTSGEDAVRTIWVW